MGHHRLHLIRRGPEPLIQVFVHGLCNGTLDHRDALIEDIRAARPAGRVYLFHWNSGNELTSLPLFTLKQSLAQELGIAFRRHVAKVPGARELPMTFIGHSLGARLLHWALAHHEWRSYRLANVVLMGSAASRYDDDWHDCANEVSGKLVNAWSSDDSVLRLKMLDWAAGLGPLPRHPNIKSFDTKLGHGDYWPNLEWVLQRALGAGFEQHSREELEHEVECPYCGQEYRLLPDLYLCDPGNGGCGLHFEVDARGRTYYLTNHIRCGERGCGTHQSLFVDDPEYVYHCGECDGVLWERGKRIPAARQLT